MTMLVTAVFRIDGTPEEVAELAAEMDEKLREFVALEESFQGIPEGAVLDEIYVGTFISKGIYTD